MAQFGFAPCELATEICCGLTSLVKLSSAPLPKFVIHRSNL